MSVQSLPRLQSRQSHSMSWRKGRRYAIAFVLVSALLAFEIFNFDTTSFALGNLLGGVSFAGLKWSAVLAFAFCAIDFAGLARIFTPETQLENEPKEVWYLMGAWLLGATMNAVMTWWAVSLTLLSHDFGNEVLSREVLLRYVPVFVAVLVWLTRILFIGALSVAGESLFNGDVAQQTEQRPERLAETPVRMTAAPRERLIAEPERERAPKRQPKRNTARPAGMPATVRPVAAAQRQRMQQLHQ